jgi:Protein of unknown function (DUF2971)
VFYHYTNAAALKSILETGSLWFSDWRFLNDTNEVQEGFNIASQHFEHLLETKSVNATHAQDLRRYFEISRYGAWIACFSEDGDSLTQWQAYGDNGRGYALGFDDELKDVLAADLFIERVHYTLAGEKDDWIHEEIKKIVERMVLEGSDPAISMGWTYLTRLLSRVKHEAFTHEREVRALFPQHFMGPLGANIRQKFNPKNGVLVPVMEIRTKPTSVDDTDASNRAINGNLLLPLKQIVMGPAHIHATSKIGLSGFLRRVGYESVEIFTSKVPYRPQVF